ncbi:hypothetical protein SARC_11262 [Sphaeroforma arctica JP610]|uniref:Uncharacterized protein n=1 Tax=Sphaeroforma arctica JP610 TaxID=667725 RepID=A0A0L0FHG8_9EUKA|nr:hypothetical protein SARC_11262 [Sphaeroforma arctica JP610]KNC76222.1 hypothetical protein SARC_11262 [Sphaeroforma arctica JP610]|eukprot:XP_014150124.1 hypothetical protein SARC_11262 [Sphaeroforma arctica JP610]
MSINVRITKPYEPMASPDDRESMTRAANFFYAKIPATAKTPMQVDPRGTGTNRLKRVTQAGMKDYAEMFGGNPYEKRTHANSAQRDERIKAIGQTVEQWQREAMEYLHRGKEAGISINQEAKSFAEQTGQQFSEHMRSAQDGISRPPM